MNLSNQCIFRPPMTTQRKKYALGKLITHIILWMFIVASQVVQAQGQLPNDTIPSKAIEVLSIRKTVRLTEGDKVVEYYYGDVVFRHENTLFYCDSATKEGKLLHAWGNVVIKQGDTVTLFSDILHYNGYTRIAELDNRVVLENKQSKLYTNKLIYDAYQKIGYYTHGGRLVDESSVLKSKRGVYRVNDEEMTFSEQVEILNPDFKLKTDSLVFNDANKTAKFVAPTIISFDNAKVYTEGGYYNTKNRLAYFDKNPQYQSGDALARAKIMTYNGEDKIFKLIDQAWYQDKESFAKADTIVFFEQLDLVHLIGNFSYSGESRNLSGDKLEYNRQSKSFKTSGRSVIQDGNQVLESYFTDYDNESGISIAAGEVIYYDQKNNVFIYADTLLRYQEDSRILAFGCRPLVVIEVDGERMFMSGDTLKITLMPRPSESSETETEDINEDINPKGEDDKVDDGQMMLSINEMAEKSESDYLGKAAENTENIPEMLQDTTQITSDLDLINNADNQEVTQSEQLPQDSLRLMSLQGMVKVYKKGLSALCDSLTFSTLDSIFSLFQSPWLWSDSTQFSGDTILIRAKNSKINQMEILNNALVILTEDESFFDQIGGKHLLAQFNDGKAEEIAVRGNVETVYYVKNEQKEYTGVNTKKSGKMNIWIADQKIKKIRYYTEPEGKFLPMGQTDHEGIRLAGFYWNIHSRPENPIGITEVDWIDWDAMMSEHQTPPEEQENLLEQEDIDQF